MFDTKFKRGLIMVKAFAHCDARIYGFCEHCGKAVCVPVSTNSECFDLGELLSHPPRCYTHDYREGSLWAMPVSELWEVIDHASRR